MVVSNEFRFEIWGGEELCDDSKREQKRRKEKKRDMRSYSHENNLIMEGDGFNMGNGSQTYQPIREH